jgi:hypothetical protein
MSHTSPSTPTKDDIVILYNLYERQSELQKIIDDDQASTEDKLQAELELTEIRCQDRGEDGQHLLAQNGCEFLQQLTQQEDQPTFQPFLQCWNLFLDIFWWPEEIGDQAV